MRHHIALTILAPAIMLIGLKGAIPEINDQDSALVTGSISSTSPLEPAPGKSDRAVPAVSYPSWNRPTPRTIRAKKHRRRHSPPP